MEAREHVDVDATGDRWDVANQLIATTRDARGEDRSRALLALATSPGSWWAALDATLRSHSWRVQDYVPGLTGLVAEDRADLLELVVAGCHHNGRLRGAARDLTPADADHMAAIAAGFASLSRSAGRHFKAGPVRQAVIEMEDAVLLVTDAGEGSCFAVLSDADSDIGMVAYEMAMVVERIGHSLGTQPRPTSAHAR